MDRAVSDLDHELHRKPTVDEIVAKVGVGHDHPARARRILRHAVARLRT